VADAVAIEPVSIAGFPAYREIYREFLESRDPACVIGHKRYGILIACDEIPYSMKQGIFPTATGKGFSLNRETGRPNRELRIDRPAKAFLSERSRKPTRRIRHFATSHSPRCRGYFKVWEPTNWHRKAFQSQPAVAKARPADIGRPRLAFIQTSQRGPFPKRSVKRTHAPSHPSFDRGRDRKPGASAWQARRSQGFGLLGFKVHRGHGEIGQQTDATPIEGQPFAVRA
jgi:hypothetical protein